MFRKRVALGNPSRNKVPKTPGRDAVNGHTAHPYKTQYQQYACTCSVHAYEQSYACSPCVPIGGMLGVVVDGSGMVRAGRRDGTEDDLNSN